MKILSGKALVFGDNIDTDQIYPGRYIELTDHAEIAEHAMEGVDPHFVEKVRSGDIVVGGKNFGCGSSREHAVICLKNSNIGGIIAKSFARIFYRNCINLGLPAIEVKNLEISEGESISIDLDKGKVFVGSREYAFAPLPEYVLEIIRVDGIFNYYAKNNGVK